MTTFLLIRHATHAVVAEQLIGRDSEVGLSDEGREQATALAERLAPLPIQALYGSPVARVRETGLILAERLGLPLREEAGLSEVDFGEWVGQRFDELAHDPRWQAWNRFRSGTRPPDGEWMLAAQARIVATLGSLRERHPDELIAVLSHGDLIRASLAHALGIPLDLFLRLTIECASVSVVEWQAWGPTVLTVNHLGPLPTVRRP